MSKPHVATLAPSPAGVRGNGPNRQPGRGVPRVLNVTPSAISHLLRELEQSLALTLFVTRGPNARLTETGERLGRRLITAFDTIDAAITDARHQAGDVRVSALSSFLTLWLVPRLTGFQSRHPDTRLLLQHRHASGGPVRRTVRVRHPLGSRQLARPGMPPCCSATARSSSPTRACCKAVRRTCLVLPRAPVRTTGRWLPAALGWPDIAADPDVRDPGTGRAGGDRRHGRGGGGPQPGRRHAG